MNNLLILPVPNAPRVFLCREDRSGNDVPSRRKYCQSLGHVFVPGFAA